MAPKVYGVRAGRQGPFVYTSWAECCLNVSGFPGATYKGFKSIRDAEAWVFDAEPEQPHQDAPTVATTGPIQGFPPSSNGARFVPGPPPASITSQTGETASFPYSPNVPTPPETFAQTHSNPSRQSTSEAGQSSVSLSDEQQRILDMVLNGRSVFFTGSAGTGKSVLLRELIRTLKLRGMKPAITASTGIAAVNIGGTTLHSWAGTWIGLGKESADTLVDKITSSKASRQRWCHTRTLIVDEISMVDGVLLDKLDTIGRAIRHNYQVPFGGIQVISGDFLQLPPVPDQLDGVSVPIKFAFEAAVWPLAFGEPEILTKVFRQRDQTFVDVLTKMRYGQLDDMSSTIIMSLERPLQYGDGIDPTELYPKRDQVLWANQGRLERIREHLHTFHSEDNAGTDSYGKPLTKQHAEKVLERLVAVSTLQLKIGAQVMLIKNMVQGHLVNGSLGKVIGFETSREAEQFRHEIGTADRENDMAFLTRSEDEPERRSKRRMDPNAQWPLVQFTSGRKLLLMPETFEVMNVRGRVEAVRCQVPLILAWALSIHKSQGQTLERVKVSLSATFEKGQAYVALSRATSMEGLQVVGFNPSKVQAHPKVIAWESAVLNKRRMWT